MPVSLSEAMNEARIGSVQWTVIVLLIGVMICDGLDLQLAAFSAPLLMAKWQLTKLQFTPLLAAAMIGTTIGSLVGSRGADRYGRKPALVASVAFFGALTLACAAATGPRTFVLYRFLSGLGLGAAFPIAAALMSEWMPPRAAGKAISIMTIGIPVGIVLGALAASWFLPRFGWRYSFAGIGTLCLVYSAYMLWKLPESPVYLLYKNRPQQAYALLSKAWKRPVDSLPNVVETAQQRGPQSRLLDRSNRRVNISLWLSVLAASCATYGVSGWVTVVLTGLHLPLATALRGPLTFSMAAILGAAVVGWVLVRLGSQRTMVSLSIAAAASAAVISVSAYEMAPGSGLLAVVFVSLAVAGFCSGALQPTFYVVAARAYDTSIRTTGVGVAATFSRIGAIVSSFAGGAVLGVGHAGGFFALMAAFSAVAGAAIFVFNRHIPRGRGSRPLNASSPVVAGSSAANV